MIDWNKIRAAVRTVGAGMADRMDSDGIKVYRAGTIIRVDIPESVVANDVAERGLDQN